ncbi:MAG TPA: two-component regulator propeller domain-containing protein, partial [Pyrinomonadaceae bacterium]|nr:two-component regulator propeller domain-containing protein [Pyrinomonadaceae bacterium]
MPDKNLMLSICFLLIFFNGLVGQNSPPLAQNFHQWGSVTIFNGLPSDSVRAIVQTPDGILWFGTDNGLARFDGRRVQTVSLPDTNSNKILALKLAADGALWIGTENGAFRFESGKATQIEGTKDLSITAILLGENILLATANGVLLTVGTKDVGSLHAEKASPQTLTGSDSQMLKFTSLINDGGRVIVGTAGRSLMIFQEHSLSEIRSSPRPYFINTLACDSNGNVWAGADAGGSRSGLFLLNDLANPKRVGETLGDILSVEPDGSGGVWAGTDKNGLFHFRGEQQIEHFTFENTSGSLRSNTVYAIFIDREGVVWAGTNRGVSRFDAGSPFQQTISDSPNSNFIRTLYRGSSGGVYAGTNRGLFGEDGFGWNEVPGFNKKIIYTVSVNTSGGLLVGTPDGLLDATGRTILNGDTRSIARFQGKTYAAVFGQGVIEIKGDDQGNVVVPDQAATSLFASSDKLFIGTAGQGLFSFDGTNTVQLIAPEDLGNTATWKILAGAGNSLWIAGQSGLYRYRDGQIERIISDHDVRDFVVNGSDIWAATSDAGLVHARYDDVFGWLVSNISVEQGLPSEKAFALILLDHRLLIGTNRGLSTYAPGTVAPAIAAVRILSRRLHDVSELRSTIALDYPQNSLLIEVAGQSSRTFPEEFQYAFLLKNGKGEVIDKRISTDAQFAPDNLSPGDYTIEARTFNRDLLSSEPLIVRFSVASAPFPWTATALAVLLAIAVIALIIAMIESRRIAQRNRELAAARFDLANEAERERRRIARDLHDQTLADLRNLQMMSDQLSPGNAEFRSEIESVSTEIRRICEDLSPSVLENVGLTASLEFLLSHTVENYRFHAAEDLEEKIKFPMNVQLQIYRIAQEILTNIKRHSNAALVEMHIEVTAENEFILTIKNDGEPFDPSVVSKKGRGIANIRSRAALIRSEIAWQTNGSGTTFELRKPT